MSTETERSINLEKREQNYTESDMKRNCEKENTIKEIHLGFLNIFQCAKCVCVGLCATEESSSSHLIFLFCRWFFFSCFFLFFLLFSDGILFVCCRLKYIRNSFQLSMCECFNVWLLANRFRGPFECVIFHLFRVSSTISVVEFRWVGLLYLWAHFAHTHIRIGNTHSDSNAEAIRQFGSICIENQRITSKEPPKGWERDAFFVWHQTNKHEQRWDERKTTNSTTNDDSNWNSAYTKSFQRGWNISDLLRNAGKLGKMRSGLKLNNKRFKRITSDLKE